MATPDRAMHAVTAHAHIGRRLARRVRAQVRASSTRLRDFAPVGRTAQRIPADRVPPPPGAFRRFGADSWLVPPAEVVAPEHIEIGARVIVLEHSMLRVTAAPGDRPVLVLGDDVRLARFNSIVCAFGVTIGDHVASSDSVSVFDVWNAAAGEDGPLRGAPVVIDRNAYLGCNSIVCPGVTIGEGAYVGEGAVVYDDVPAHSVVYGNPAVVMRSYDAAAGAWVEGSPP